MPRHMTPTSRARSSRSRSTGSPRLVHRVLGAQPRVRRGRRSRRATARRSSSASVPGKPKYSEVVAEARLHRRQERCTSGSTEVVDAPTQTPYKTGSIVIYDRTQTEVARFNLRAVLAVEAVGVRPQRRQRRGHGRGAHHPARVPRLGVSERSWRACRPSSTFTLPKGYVDADGHAAPARDDAPGHGARRDRAAARPARHAVPTTRTSRSSCSPGSSPSSARCRQVTPSEVENLFAADLAFLQDLYGIINFGDPADVEALQAVGAPRRAGRSPDVDAAEPDAELDDRAGRRRRADAAEPAPLAAARPDRRGRPARARAMKLYPSDALWDEIAYLAYHLHWDLDTLLDLEHADRARLIRSVADLNERAWEAVRRV